MFYSRVITTNVTPIRKNRITTIENDFKQDYTDLYEHPEDVTVKVLLRLNVFGYNTVASDIYSQKLPHKIRMMLSTCYPVHRNNIVYAHLKNVERMNQQKREEYRIRNKFS